MDTKAPQASHGDCSSLHDQRCHYQRTISILRRCGTCGLLNIRLRSRTQRLRHRPPHSPADIVNAVTLVRSSTVVERGATQPALPQPRTAECDRRVRGRPCRGLAEPDSGRVRGFGDASTEPGGDISINLQPLAELRDAGWRTASPPPRSRSPPQAPRGSAPLCPWAPPVPASADSEAQPPGAAYDAGSSPVGGARWAEPVVAARSAREVSRPRGPDPARRPGARCRPSAWADRHRLEPALAIARRTSQPGCLAACSVQGRHQPARSEHAERSTANRHHVGSDPG
jgi:hypothetical protein